MQYYLIDITVFIPDNITMNTLAIIVSIFFAFFVGFALLMTLTINSWGKPCEENDDLAE